MYRLRALLTRKRRILVYLLVAAVTAVNFALLYDFRPHIWAAVDLVNSIGHSASARFSRLSEGVKTTALLDVDLARFDLNATGESGDGRRYGAIEWLGSDRLLLGTDYGQLFLVDIADGNAVATKLPLRVELNREALGEHAGRNTIRVNTRWLRLDDLLLFDNRRQLAVSFSQWDPEQHCVSLRVAVVPVPQDWSAVSAKDLREVFRSTPCLPLKTAGHALAGHQSGGRLVEATNGKLLISIGDFEFDGREGLPHHPQDPNVDYGKIVEFDPASGEKRIVSAGHRNPQGLARDDQGRIWSSEHGPRGGDELNLIVAGANYGWPEVSLGVDYVLGYWPNAAQQGRHARYRPPAFAWVPSIATSQLIQVRNFADEWDGDLLLGGLATKSLYRIRLEGDTVQYVEPITIENRVRDIVQDDRGKIWLWTDEGNLLRLTPRPRSAGSPVASLSAPARNVMEGCLECHDLSAAASSAGRIPLGGVAGRRVASAPGVDYTPALKSLGGVWTAARIDAFIAAPDAVAPGTAMPSVPINDAAVRAEIVTFLANLK